MYTTATLVQPTLAHTSTTSDGGTDTCIVLLYSYCYYYMLRHQSIAQIPG